MNESQASERMAFNEVVLRLDEALAAPETNTIPATSTADHVVLRLRLGLMSRLLVVGTLVEDPPASAGAFDCLRSMAEAYAHLSWLVEAPSGTLEQRALCIQLGQANADFESRRAIAEVMKKEWVPQDVLTNALRRRALAEDTQRRVRKQHGSNCPSCGGGGRGYAQVERWLKERARRAGALKRDVDLYTLWKGASADAHQVQPQRWNQPELGGHVLALPAKDRHMYGKWALQCFLEGWWFVAAVIRPEAQSVITDVDTKVGGILQEWRSVPSNAPPDDMRP